MEFIQALIEFIRANPTVQTLLNGVLLLGISYVGYKRLQFQSKGELAKRSEELEVAQQEQINASLEAFRKAFSEDRQKFDAERAAWEKERLAFQQSITDWQVKHNTREKEIKALIEQQRIDQQRIKALEDDKRQRDDQIETLTKRVAALEQERDELAQQVKDRDGELKQRDATISHQQGEIKTLNDKVDALQKRIDDLEKKEKGDTGQLDAVKVPEAAPAAPPAAESPSVARGTVEQVDTNSKAKEEGG